HPQDGPVQIDILSTRQLRVKARAYLQQGADAPIDVCTSGAWLGDAREDFEQCAFTRSIAPDDANHFPRLHLKRDVLQGPDRLVEVGSRRSVSLEQVARTSQRHLQRVDN